MELIQRIAFYFPAIFLTTFIIAAPFETFLHYKVQTKRFEEFTRYSFFHKNKEEAVFDFSGNTLSGKMVSLSNHSVYMITEHSGGESGGFYHLTFVYKDLKDHKLKHYTFSDISGYASIEVVDINADKKKELVIDSDRGYQKSFIYKNQTIALTPAAYQGEKGVYKDVYVFEKGSLRKAVKDKEYASYYEKQFQKTEETLRKLKGKVFQSGKGQADAFLIEVIQYLSYMTDYNRYNSAMENIKKSEIRIQANEAYLLYEVLIEKENK